MSEEKAEHVTFTRDQVAFRIKNGVVTESITMRNHLEALLSKEPIQSGNCDGGCVYCLGDHEPACLWVAAKAFLERGCVP